MVPPTASSLETVAARVANHAAAHVRRHLGRARTLRTKSSATDVVTYTDIEVETLVRRELEAQVPGSTFVGEEQDDHTGTSDVAWIIDPIDGTVNFLYDLPVVAVSIAATVCDEVVAGAVVDVLRDETFTAHRGGGATREGMPIAANTPAGLAQALLVTGFSYDAQLRTAQAAVLQRVVGVARDVRCFGSAALHLCWVACGRVDGYWETDLKPWDVAAGGLIAQEAGAEVRSPVLDGRAMTLAAPRVVFDPLIALVDPGAREGREAERGAEGPGNGHD